MIRIAICDDEKELTEQLSLLLNNYFKSNMLNHSICSFNNAEDFLNSELSTYDIVFLDIRLGNVNGIDIAKELNIQNPKAIIMLISQYHEYMSSGYRVKAFRYLLKPDLVNVLKEDMDSALEELNLKQGVFEFKVYNDSYKVEYNDIIYFESKYPKVYIISSKELQQDNFIGNINEVYEKVSSADFIRIGKSYLINAKHTKKIINSRAYLSNGDVLNVSRDYIEQAKNNLLRIKRSNNWNI